MRRPRASDLRSLLVQGFDSISADGLERLVTVRAEVSPGLRFEEGLCFLKAIPFRDCHSLGWGRPLHTNNLSTARAEITTACVRLCSLNALCNVFIRSRPPCRIGPSVAECRYG